MKKFKSLSVVIVGVALLITALPLHRAMAECHGTNLNTKTMVLVSTTVALPTTLLATNGPGPAGCVQIMLNWSGSGTYPNSEYLLLSDTSTGFSSAASTGTIRIPAGQRPSDFFDLGEYSGPLYAVVIGTTGAGVAPAVSVLRKR